MIGYQKCNCIRRHILQLKCTCKFCTEIISIMLIPGQAASPNKHSTVQLPGYPLFTSADPFASAKNPNCHENTDQGDIHIHFDYNRYLKTINGMVATPVKISLLTKDCCSKDNLCSNSDERDL